MNESQIRNMTPDELLSAFECGQLSGDNVRQAFGQVVEALNEANSNLAEMTEGQEALEEALEEQKDKAKDRDALYNALRRIQDVIEGVDL